MAFLVCAAIMFNMYRLLQGIPNKREGNIYMGVKTNTHTGLPLPAAGPVFNSSAASSVTIFIGRIKVWLKIQSIQSVQLVCR